jgi:hypothetical protein
MGIFCPSPKCWTTKCRISKCRLVKLVSLPYLTYITYILGYHLTPTRAPNPSRGLNPCGGFVRRVKMDSTFSVFFRHFVFRHFGPWHQSEAPKNKIFCLLLNSAEVIKISVFQALHLLMRT